MINERIYDDSIFLPIGSPTPEPHTTGALLGQLKLVRADRDAQVAGIREWLGSHKPSDALLRSFKRRGYDEVLPQS